MNIGVFDSGIGGLTVLKAFVRELPNYTYKYLGDNVNAPYGEKTSDEIYNLTIRGIEFLFSQNCSLVISACNTVSTVLPRIQQEWLPLHHPDKKVLGIIRPTAENMIMGNDQKIYLMATPATVKSKSYEKELAKLGSSITVEPIACPGLAKAIEESGGKTTAHVVASIKSALSNVGVLDVRYPIYLACTHYEFVEREIKINFNGKIVHQSKMCANSLKKYLLKHESELGLIHQKDMRIMSSKEVSRFASVARGFLT